MDPERIRFCRRFFPEVTAAQWSDWRWQLRHRLQDLGTLERFFCLSAGERAALEQRGSGLPVAVTPYYAALLDPDHPGDPLRRTVLPVADEWVRAVGEAEDPLDEARDRVVNGLIHRHPDRVVFLASHSCAAYCRYCTRSRLVGQKQKLNDRWEQALAYIAAHGEIREVLVSGGDPLLLSTARLTALLSRLRAIPHVELVRLGSRIPMVLPMRVTKRLVAMLQRFQPLVMSIHVTHPAELTTEALRALHRLADAGVMLVSQTVLLAGINDDFATMSRLLRSLVRHRVRPYYLYQCDPIWGSAHFRVPVEQGIALVEQLARELSGLALPRYVIDAPGGGGKITIGPVTMVGREAGFLVLKDASGRIWRYPDPPVVSGTLAGV
ncbi:MAG: KamA family radical SAM protein [Magnetococcales bacterium]|nr:KamA family radical SAM protein [Magnetococcales bacterium]NGZ05340.1 KamA family radical SAM protein [Magnetococcales bacterium]